ncbi:23S rRNA (adenine(2030)-N(6))-methyltransferase RlmJ [Rudaea cellulosilytica]|uniref:23S rRNA (adenine(2030)-N(6))-methyltransferase RlmJ n=1 Tax=Rudaea cellulosilytica TaxID=540746 RepID=UPI0003717A88|nr:23S rRNA (adenine(2030)-N(6))-methyltransferase RlmJ [Rudaea cellulosilytica]
MNYRHAFHAGNFADVFKHAILIGLIDALKAKPTPFCYIDTHAGAGRYDLRDEEARKTGEFVDGVQRLLVAANLPDSLRPYFDLLRAANAADANGHLNVYPGSPLIASLSLRDGDRIALCEVQEAETAALRKLFADDKRVGVHQRDGYAALAGLVPPKERRGVVLIDPPFEAQEAEFRTIQSALADAYAHWPTGIYAIWYPIKLHRQVLRFQRWFAKQGIKKTLVAELMIDADDSPLRLNGCGMVIVNAPWQFDAWLARLLPDLARLLARSPRASHRLEWLTRE